MAFYPQARFCAKFVVPVDLILHTSSPARLRPSAAFEWRGPAAWLGGVLTDLREGTRVLLMAPHRSVVRLRREEILGSHRQALLKGFSPGWSRVAAGPPPGSLAGGINTGGGTGYRQYTLASDAAMRRVKSKQQEPMESKENLEAGANGVAH